MPVPGMNRGLETEQGTGVVIPASPERLLLCRAKAKKKAFTKYSKKYSDGQKTIEEELNAMKKHCSAIRVLAHTQISKIHIGQKKAHLMEIQVSLLPQ